MPDPKTAQPTFDEWLKGKISSGQYGRSSSNIVFDNKAFTVVPGANNFTTAELTKKYQDEIDQGVAMGRWKTPADAAAEDAKAAEAKAQGKRDTTDSEIEAFFQHMNKAPDPNDPDVAQLLTSARNAAGQAASDRGIEGSISLSEMSRASGMAYKGVDDYRKGLAAQVLGLKSNRELGLADLAGRERQFNKTFDYNAEMDRYGIRMNQANAKVGQGQGVGAAIGGGLGTIVGAYFGQPGLGAQAGSSLGGAAGGWASGQGSPPSPRRYGGGA
jgi:hypothetical protein